MNLPAPDYRHQEDETVASRGSISMRTAILKMSATDKTRFEVHSTPSRGHTSGAQKWYMKANHPVEASRWTKAIGLSIEWCKRDTATATEDEKQRRKSGESDSSVPVSKLPSSGSTRASLASSSVLRKSTRSKHASVISVGGTLSEGESLNGSYQTDRSGNGSPDLEASYNRGHDADDEDGGEESSIADSTHSIPHANTFELHGNATITQLDLSAQLLANFAVPAESSQLKAGLSESLTSTQSMLQEYLQMVRDRDEWWRKQLERERNRQSIWEESLATVVKEGETLERELRMRSRRRGSKFFDSGVTFSGEGMNTIRQRPSMIIPPKAVHIVEEPVSPLAPSPPAITSPPVAKEHPPPSTSEAPPTLKGRSKTDDTITQVSLPTPNVADTAESVYDTDEEDEFFDAIEANNIPNLVVPPSLTSPTHPEANFSVLPSILSNPTWSGYHHQRTSLNLSQDRPSTSLWSVLKHNIGKDLTKISFPVGFNEPTSMLQRMVSVE